MASNNEQVKDILRKLNINEDEIAMKIAESYAAKEGKAKYHVVDYAGFFHIQTEDVYGGQDILNAEHIGYENAKAFAEKIVSFLNSKDND